MHITTVHTLAFSMRTAGNEQHNAAMAIVKGGASTMGLSLNTTNQPMPEGDNVARGTSIQAMSEDKEKCEHYWNEVQRALALIGVDVTSP